MNVTKHALSSRYSAIKRLMDGDDVAALEEMERIRVEEAEAALGSAVTAEGQTPRARGLDMSKQLAAHLRSAQGGGTLTPEEGGPKP